MALRNSAIASSLNFFLLLALFALLLAMNRPNEEDNEHQNNDLTIVRNKFSILKAMSHEAICPCNLQCNFCRKEYCRLPLGCQTYANLFTTCNEIIFYARRVFKNVSGVLIMSYYDWFLLKTLRDKLQWGCHTLQLVA